MPIARQKNLNLLLALALGNFGLHGAVFLACETGVLGLVCGCQIAQLGRATFGHGLLVVHIHGGRQVAIGLLVGTSRFVALGLRLELLGRALIIFVFGGVISCFSHGGTRMK